MLGWALVLWVFSTPIRNPNKLIGSPRNLGGIHTMVDHESLSGMSWWVCFISLGKVLSHVSVLSTDVCVQAHNPWLHNSIIQCSCGASSWSPVVFPSLSRELLAEFTPCIVMWLCRSVKEMLSPTSPPPHVGFLPGLGTNHTCFHREILY